VTKSLVAVSTNNKKSQLLGVGFFFLACALLYNFNHAPAKSHSAVSKKGLFADVVRASSGADHLVHFFTVGSVAAASDVQWIQALQTVDDRCAENVQKRGCYSIFGGLAITALKLDPRNLFVAKYGVPIADVAVIDIEAGTQILELGLVKNEASRDLNYWAGYHYMMEVNDNEKAANHFYRAAQLGAPRWVYSLAAKLYSESGKLEFAQKFLSEEIKNSPDAHYTDRLKERLTQVEASLARLPSSEKRPK
jgi:hypothetical protein